MSLHSCLLAPHWFQCGLMASCFLQGGAACSWGDCVGVCAALACGAPESSCCPLCLPCHTACPLMSGAARAGSSSQGPVLPDPCPPRGWGSQPRSGHSMGLAPECQPCISCSSCLVVTSGSWERALVGHLHQGLSRCSCQGVSLDEADMHSAAWMRTSPPGHLCPGPSGQRWAGLVHPKCESPHCVQSQRCPRFPFHPRDFFCS